MTGPNPTRNRTRPEKELESIRNDLFRRTTESVSGLFYFIELRPVLGASDGVTTVFLPNLLTATVRVEFFHRNCSLTLSTTEMKTSKNYIKLINDPEIRNLANDVTMTYDLQNNCFWTTQHKTKSDDVKIEIEKVFVDTLNQPPYYTANSEDENRPIE